MADLPTGTVTFLLTDIEGSTRLWELQPEAMPPALARALQPRSPEEPAMNVTPPSSPAAIELWEVLDLLTALVQKSLVAYEQGEQGQGRYRLLETVRQYARDRLLESDEAAAVRERHLEFFLHWAEQRPNAVRQETEHDNLRAALRWSEAQGHAEAGLRLAGAIWGFWQNRGYATEGREHLEALLALPEAEARTAARAHSLHIAGRMAQLPGDWGAARALMEESLAISRELGNREYAAWVLDDLGRVLTELGEYGTARAILEESLAISRDLDDKGGIAYSLGNLSLVALYQGDYGEAQALLEEGLALHPTLTGVDIAWGLNNLGRAAYEQEEYERARALLEESRRIAGEAGYNQGIADSLGHLGLVALYQGDAGAAKALLEESLARFRELREKPGIAWTLCGLGSVAHRQGEYGTARALHGESLALCLEVGNKPGIVKNLAGLAAVAVTQAQPERATRLFAAAEALREVQGTPLPPSDRDEHDHSVAAVRAALGAEAFAAAWAEGRALPLDEAVAFALAEGADG